MSDSYFTEPVGTNDTYALSSAGNQPPSVEFKFHSNSLMVAKPPGVTICCEATNEFTSHVIIRSHERGQGVDPHIAEITVHARDRDLTMETMEIASALYWSWWRAQDMRSPGHAAVSEQ